ncbi:MAG TPA: hypothetical protein VFA63_17180 [Pseudonocardiaceae bacterium]|nr:hypothetical protein [Pseudonocardiaceae bacterium]
MTGDPVGRKLSAALRAQASGLDASPPRESAPDRPPGAAHAPPRLPAWAVLALAVLLGAMAGALAAVISIW